MKTHFQDEFPEYEDLGHTFNYDRVMLETYRLMSHILASEKIARYAADDPERKFRGPDKKPTNTLEALQEKFFNEEASRLLLFIAITIRNLDERLPFVFDKMRERYCGHLSENGRNYEQIQLREACNKIIHASRYVSFDYETIEPETQSPRDKLYLPPTYVRPCVNLEGKRPAGRKTIKWSARINLFTFTDLVVECVKVHQAQERAALYR